MHDVSFKGVHARGGSLGTGQKCDRWLIQSQKTVTGETERMMAQKENGGRENRDRFVCVCVCVQMQENWGWGWRTFSSCRAAVFKNKLVIETCVRVDGDVCMQRSRFFSQMDEWSTRRNKSRLEDNVVTTIFLIVNTKATQAKLSMII